MAAEFGRTNLQSMVKSVPLPAIWPTKWERPMGSTLEPKAHSWFFLFIGGHGKVFSVVPLGGGFSWVVQAGPLSQQAR